MSARRPCEQPVPTCSISVSHEVEPYGLLSDSYTVQRLQHASPEHLHITSRRFFIGPLPKGWLQSHRKSWYRSWLGMKDYSSREATFSAADTSLTHHRQITGLMGPSPAALYRQSFPQPDDLDLDEENETEQAATVRQVPSVEPTRLEPVDTSQETRPEIGEQEIHAAGGTAHDSVHQRGPERPAIQGIAVNGVSPTIRPSSTSRVNEAYYTAPESKHQRERFKDLSSSSRIPEESPEGGTADQNAEHPSILVVPKDSYPDPAHERTPSISTLQGVPVSRDIGSEASLVRHTQQEEEEEEEHAAAAATAGEADRRAKGSNISLQQKEPHVLDDEQPWNADMSLAEGSRRLDRRILNRVTSVRCSVEDRLMDRQRRLQTRLSRTQDDAARRQQQRSASREGEIIRAERMLVRVDITQHEVPKDYSENASVRIDTRPIEKWREYLVVCRRGFDEHTPLLLQLYKTRVIPQVQTSRVKQRFSHEIQLRRSTTGVNMFSSLDKTFVLWYPYQQLTRIFIMRARSAAHSVEWYTFLREALGWHRASTLMVYVPDLDIPLRLKNPFAHLEAKRNYDENRCSVVLETLAREELIAKGIINTCIDTLQKCPQLSSIVNLWIKHEKIGLAWRRYDRLEWVQGANEKRMYGAHAMRESHELELRPKQHYPTYTNSAGPRRMEEPYPIEGFMILLTSQRGRHKRFGKAFHRRLYLYTQDQYLCFCKPSKASPPPPPRPLTIAGNHVPSSNEVRRNSPIVHDIDPYPIDDDGHISWLIPGRKAHARRRDAEAFAEHRRNARNLARAEGYFNLCRVAEVRPVAASSEPEDDHVNGGDVDFHGHPRSNTDTNVGTSPHRPGHQSKCNRTFELVLDDGLVTRFRTYNMETRHTWIERLRDLSIYWKARTRDDINRLKSVRQLNLERMGIDEEQESMLGQFAQKWEVVRAEACPELFHTCGLSGCRAVKMSGHLYRKTRRRGAFTKCSVLLIEGKLLIFQGTVRTWTGAHTPHTHLTRQAVLDLQDCYVYSGIITSYDLPHQGQTFDSYLPGHHSMPRIYLSDGWTSSDEDTTTTFVIWQATHKSFFRSEEEETKVGVGEASGHKRRRWRQVTALGKPGKSIVFRTRSRAERDLWVLAIETEIDRLQQKEDMRIVEQR
ncbi:hypothetical protein VTO42DRAFT_7240 [Malbranchea cinnamomea]